MRFISDLLCGGDAHSVWLHDLPADFKLHCGPAEKVWLHDLPADFKLHCRPAEKVWLHDLPADFKLHCGPAEQVERSAKSVFENCRCEPAAYRNLAKQGSPECWGMWRCYGNKSILRNCERKSVQERKEKTVSFVLFFSTAFDNKKQKIVCSMSRTAKISMHLTSPSKNGLTRCSQECFAFTETFRADSDCSK